MIPNEGGRVLNVSDLQVGDVIYFGSPDNSWEVVKLSLGDPCPVHIVGAACINRPGLHKGEGAHSVRIAGWRWKRPIPREIPEEVYG